MRRGVRRGPRPGWSFRLLRLTDVKLPLDHEEGALKSAILGRLKIPARDLVGFSVFRRATDARKRGAIALTYTLDIEVDDEAALLKRFAKDRNLSRAPDMNYRFVTRAPAGSTARPVVIGAGPCGLFAGLVLAQMGFRPLILESGKVVRERTKDTWGLWRRSVLTPESNVQFGEGGAGLFSDGKLASQIRDASGSGAGEGSLSRLRATKRASSCVERALNGYNPAAAGSCIARPRRSFFSSS